jgi:hypothetical protein
MKILVAFLVTAAAGAAQAQLSPWAEYNLRQAQDPLGQTPPNTQPVNPPPRYQSEPYSTQQPQPQTPAPTITHGYTTGGQTYFRNSDGSSTVCRTTAGVTYCR